MMQHTTPIVSHYAKRASAAVLAGVLAVSLCPVADLQPSQAYAVTAAEKQAEAEEALANLNAMQETLDRLSAEYGEAVAAQEEAEASRDAAEERIADIEAEIEDLQGRLSNRAREMYRSGDVSFLQILLGSNSFEEFTTNFDMVTRVNTSDAEMVEQSKALQQEAEEQAAVYEEQASVAAQKAAEAEDAAEQAQATIAEMQATYDSLSEEAAELLEEERAAQEAAERARAAAVVAESAQVAATNNNASNNAGDGNSGGSNDSAGSGDSGSSNSGSTNTGYDASSDTTAVQPSETGNDTVSRAYACLGCDYVWGGVGPGGYDCSGLVSYCLTGQHVRLGTTYTFLNWPQVSDPQPGDICVNSGHTGIYIGGGQMIHASTYGVGVIIGPVQSGMIIVRWPG